MHNMKIVKIKITWSSFPNDIIEDVDIRVPLGLSENDENQYIQREIEDKYEFMY